MSLVTPKVVCFTYPFNNVATFFVTLCLFLLKNISSAELQVTVRVKLSEVLGECPSPLQTKIVPPSPPHSVAAYTRLCS